MATALLLRQRFIYAQPRLRPPQLPPREHSEKVANTAETLARKNSLAVDGHHANRQFAAYFECAGASPLSTLRSTKPIAYLGRFTPSAKSTTPRVARIWATSRRFKRNALVVLTHQANPQAV